MRFRVNYPGPPGMIVCANPLSLKDILASLKILARSPTAFFQPEMAKQLYTDYSQCIPDTSGTTPSTTSTSSGSAPTIIADANYWFSL